MTHRIPLHTHSHTHAPTNTTPTVWDDIPPMAVSVGTGSATPAFTAYNGVLKAYEFVGSALEKDMHMTWQLPHRWLEGSDAKLHIHIYVPNDASGGVIKFSADYTWVNIDAVEGATANVSGTLTVGANAGNLHKILSITTLSGSGKTISSAISIRLYRNPTDAADTFASSVWLKSADIHAQLCRLGSTQEYII